MSKSPIIIERLAPIHPGEVLLEDFIAGYQISQNRLALAIGVSPRRINEIVHGKRSITANTALRLGKFFGTNPMFWLNLQTQYDIDVEIDKLGASLESVPVISDDRKQLV